MKILITGATGFLGKYLVREVARQGHTPIAFGRNPAVGEHLPCTFIQGDFTHYTEIENVTQNVDIVIHAGALSTVWGTWKDFEQANVIGTENVAKACLKNQVKRLVFISSPSIYTSRKSALDIHEEDVNPKNHLNHYIRSKIKAEEILKDYQKRGLNFVILRPRGLFGIGDSSIIPRLLQANQKIGIPLIHQGRNLVDVTYVENVAYAAYLAATAAQIEGEIFNISNDETLPFKQILEKLLQEVGLRAKYLHLSFSLAYVLALILETVYRVFHLKGEPMLTRYIVCTLSSSQTLNIDKAKERLGYQPRVSIEEGISIYANWWKNHQGD